ncbi:MAG: hypothetical protein IJX44_04915 [Bacteroidaceae bacterium]|nr:hypothetical protein [Bacteroidaceae bacterium]
MKRTFIFILCLIKYFGLHSSDTTFTRLSDYVRNVYHFSRIYPQEKVWLHFDNAGYFQGDTIWFKAYVRSTHMDRHEPLSCVLYVELLSPIGQIVHTRKLKIENGECHGEFPLSQHPDWEEVIKEDSTSALKKVNDLLPGFYEVRAYTRYMLNWDEEGIFSRVFPIYNRPQFTNDYLPEMLEGTEPLPERRKELNKHDKVNVTFYPEGGFSVEGVPCRMAYLITDEEGMPLSLPAVLQTGDRMVDVLCQHDGMGVFTYTPTGKNEKLTIHYKQKTYDFELPETQTNGYAFTMDNAEMDRLKIEVRKSSDLPTRLLGMTIQHEGNVCRFDTLTIGNNPALLEINTRQLPEGVNQATLFDENGKVWASRLFFIRHEETLAQTSISLTTDTTNQQADEYTVLQIKAIQADGQPVQGHLSVAIRDERLQFASPHCESAMVNQLLGSELKGYIHNPTYYFERNDKSHRLHLDLLMMVQGWRRYDWNEMCEVDKFECPYYVEDGLILNGKVLSRRRRRPVIARNVRVWMYDDYHNVGNKGNCLTDSLGQYNFRFPDFYGRAEMHLALKDDEKVKNVRFMIDREISPVPRTYRSDETNLPLIVKEHFKQRNLNEVQQLPDVVKTVRRPIKKEGVHLIVNVDRELNRLTDKGILSTNVGEFLTSMDIGIRSSSELCAQGHYTETFYLYGDKVYLWVKRGNQGMQRTRGSSIGWDEMDIDNVKQISIYSIKYLRDHPDLHEAIRSPESRYSLNGYEKLASLQREREKLDMACATGHSAHCAWKHGMVLIDVKPKREQLAVIEGQRSTWFDGYYRPQTFTANYSQRLPEPGNDYRRTLYWNPEVKMDNQGTAIIKFRNNSTDNAWKATVAGQNPTNGTVGWNTLTVKKISTQR